METVCAKIPYMKIIKDLLEYIKKDKNEVDKKFETQITGELLYGEGIDFLKKLY